MNSKRLLGRWGKGQLIHKSIAHIQVHRVNLMIDIQRVDYMSDQSDPNGYK